MGSLRHADFASLQVYRTQPVAAGANQGWANADQPGACLRAACPSCALRKEPRRSETANSTCSARPPPWCSASRTALAISLLTLFTPPQKKLKFGSARTVLGRSLRGRHGVRRSHKGRGAQGLFQRRNREIFGCTMAIYPLADPSIFCSLAPHSFFWGQPPERERDLAMEPRSGPAILALNVGIEPSITWCKRTSGETARSKCPMKQS